MKKLLAWALTLAMSIQLLPMTVWATETDLETTTEAVTTSQSEDVIAPQSLTASSVSAGTPMESGKYNPYTLSVPIFNASTSGMYTPAVAKYSNFNVVNAMTDSNGYGAFLYVTNFGLYPENGNNYNYTMAMGDGLTRINANYQLSYAFAIDAMPDLASILHHTCHAYITMRVGTKTVGYNTSGTSSGTWSSFGKATSFSSAGNAYATPQLYLVRSGSDKGTPQIANAQLYFADTTAPSLVSVVADTASVKAGETVTITLNFSEDIRAASGVAPSETVPLELNISYQGQDLSGTAQYAYLTEVKENQLIFTYEVPDQIDGFPTDHVIQGIKASSSQSFYGQSDTFFRDYVWGAGNALYIYEQFLENNWMGGNVVFGTSSAAYYTSTQFTDLAGNPMNSFGGYFLSTPCVMDTVAPTVQSVTNAPSQLGSTGENNSRVFAGVGDTINFEVTLSEESFFAVGAVTATLNIKDKTGAYVTVTNYNTIPYPVNCPDYGTTLLAFHSYVVQEGDYLATGDTIEITKLTMASGALMDSYGNDVGTELSTTTSETQLKLDTTAPTIQIGTVTYDEGGDTTYFCVPVTVTDTESTATAVDGTYTISIPDDKTFSLRYQYAVTDNATTPDESVWSEGVYIMSGYPGKQSFSNTGNPMYFHIRASRVYTSSVPAEGLNFDLTISDHAGNTAVATTTSADKFYYDGTAPTITFSEVSDVNQGNIDTLSFTATLSDAGGIDRDEIMYLDNTGDWQSAYDDSSWTMAVEDNDLTEVVITATKEVGADEALHQYFYLKVSDRSGNESRTYLQITHENALVELVSIQDWSTCIDVEENSISSGVTSATQFLLIEDMYNTGNYFLRECYYYTVEPDTTIITSLHQDPGSDILEEDVKDWDNYSQYWHYGTMSADYTVFTEGDIENMRDTLEDIADANYYGDITVIALTGEHMYLDSLNGYQGAMNVAENSYRVRPSSVDGVSTRPTITVSTDGSWSAVKYPNNTWSSANYPDSECHQDLVGKKLIITVTGNHENWDMEQDLAGLTLSYYGYNRSGTSGASTLLGSLPVSASQTYTIPEFDLPDYDFTGFRVEAELVDFVANTPNETVTSNGLLVEVEPVTSTGDFVVSKLWTRTTICNSSNQQVLYDLSSADYAAGQPFRVGELGDGIDSNSSRTDIITFDVEKDAYNYFLRVWTGGETQGETDENQASALWQEMSRDSWFSYITDQGDWGIQYTIIYEGTPGEQEILLKKNTENIVYYQMFNNTGYLSDVKSFVVQTSNEQPTLEMELQTTQINGIDTSATIATKTLTSATLLVNMPMTVINNTPHYPYSTATDNGDGTFSITESGQYQFAVKNAFGAYAICDVTADITLDTKNPALALAHSQNETIQLSYTDDLSGEATSMADYETITIYMRYDDDDYRNQLIANGMSVNDDGYFELEKGDSQYYQPTTLNTGVFRLYYSLSDYAATIANPMVMVSIAGYYDENKADDAVLCDSISFYAVDGVGNQSNVLQVDYDVCNTRPALSSVTAYGNYGSLQSPSLTAYFTQPISLISPSQKNVDSQGLYVPAYGEYSISRQGFPAYQDGDYEIEYLDMFGQIRTDTIHFDFSGTAISGKDILITPISGTLVESDYQIYIQPENPDHILQFYYSYDWDTDEYAEVSFTPDDGSVYELGDKEAMFSDVRTVSGGGILTFHENGYVAYVVGSEEDGYVYRMIYCNNISEAVETEISYYYPNGYTDNGDGTVTADSLMVTLCSADPLRSIVGDMMPLSYTFTPETGTSYTFHYIDDQGHEGTKTVELPSNLSLVSSQIQIEDNEAPIYSVKLYAQYGNAYSPVGAAYCNSEGALQTELEAAGNMYSARLEVVVNDASSYKVVLLSTTDTSGLTYDTATDAVISGVSKSGDFISITDASASFVIAVIDEMDNIGILSPVSNAFVFDTVAPEIIDVVVASNGYDKAVVYLKVTDDKTAAADMEAYYPEGMCLVTDGGTYDGYFRYDVIANGSFDVAFRDEAKNTMIKTVTVSGIDTTAPTALITRWSPSLNNEGNARPNLTNQNVTVQIDFNKFVKSVSLEAHDGTTDYAPVTDDSIAQIIFNDGNTATVVFTASGAARLSYTALNGMDGVPLEIIMDGVIDKVAPALGYGEESAFYTGGTTPYKKTITLTPDETVIMDGVTYTPQTPFTETFYYNGAYIYTFYDLAGNTTTEQVVVTGIDDVSPVMTIGEIPPGNTVNFDVTINKAGVFTLDAGLTVSSGSLTIGETTGGTITLAATENGFYRIGFADNAGRTIYQYVSIGTIDVTAPTILAKQTTIQVRQETDVSVFTEQFFLDNLEVRDNMTDSVDILVSIDMQHVTQNHLNTIGTYTVDATATDEAGNVAVYRVYIEVFSKYQTAATVNDKNAENNGVVTITSGEMTIEVDLPEDFTGEPYSVYLAQGYYKAGTMKTLSEKMTVEGNQITTTATAGSWYTLYIVRQSREVFLTYIYVQQ